MLLVIAALAMAVPIERTQLENGLVFVLAPDTGARSVTMELAYGIGTVDEPPGHAGLARLLVELANSQPDRHGVQAHSLLDATVFESTLQPGELAAALDRTARRLRSFEAAFDEEALDALLQTYVRKVRRGDANPVYSRNSYAVTYGTGHPLANGSDGDPDSLARTTLGDVRAFARKFTAASAVLVLAGNFEKASARKLILERFADVPRGAAPAPEHPALPPRTSQRIIAGTSMPAGAAPTVAFIWPCELRPLTPDATVAVVITVALGQPNDGRLRHELMQRLGIATDVDSRMAATRIGGRIWFGATAPRGGDVDRLLQGMEDVLHALRRDGLTQQEIDNAVGLLRAQELRPAGDSLGLARQLALFEVYVHDATFLPRELELLQAVTPAEVLAFVRKHMTDANRIDFFGNPAPEPTKPE